MQGARNAALLNGAAFCGPAHTRDAAFQMEQFNSSSSPGKQTPAVRKGGSARISGEIYEVDAEGLAALDRLEQNGIRYQREEVPLSDGTEAWIYLLIAKDTTSATQDRILTADDGRQRWQRQEP
jgi:gamma-glutamylcyclotransferase (GGCT)/AIG2-like uncharacterized protein YtfP